MDENSTGEAPKQSGHSGGSGPSSAAGADPPRKKKTLIRVALAIVLLPVLTVAAVALTLMALKPYWDLKGNFLPTFDFQAADERYELLEADRARQTEATTAAEIVSSAAKPTGSDGAGTWPHFRGPGYDGISHETGLLIEWPEDGPTQLYRQPIGGGFAGFVSDAGRAWTIEQRRGDEVVTCYDLASGVELWAFGYGAAFIEQMGGDGPRATPTLDGDRLYALGAEGHLHCLDAATGDVIWKTNILGRTQNLQWGISGSPLVYDGKVFVTNSGLGGDSLLCFDKLTGKEIWTALTKQQAYSSIVTATLAGKTQLLNLAGDRLNALDPATGERLWSFPWITQNNINVSQPVLLGADRVFLSAGYGHGCAVIEISSEGGKMGATEQWFSEAMKNKFTSSIAIGDFAFGLDEGILACVDLTTGKRMWKGGRYGHGQLIAVQPEGADAGNARLIILGEKGQLVLVAADPAEYTELANFPAIKGKTWNNPALAGGLLLVRNSREMACFDLRVPEGD